MKGLPISGALALYISLTAAQATLYIPGFDPQAITADVEGVAADGHTTWRIGPGATSSPYEDPAGIAHSATLVAGPTDAYVVYDDPAIGVSLSEGCGISNGIAVCTVVAAVEGSPTQSAVVTETASGFVVQGDGALPTGVTTAPSAGSGSSAGASQTATDTSLGASQTATDTNTGASPTTSTKDNGARRDAVGTGMVLLGVALASALLL